MSTLMFASKQQPTLKQCRGTNCVTRDFLYHTHLPDTTLSKAWQQHCTAHTICTHNTQNHQSSYNRGTATLQSLICYDLLHSAPHAAVSTLHAVHSTATAVCTAPTACFAAAAAAVTLCMLHCMLLCMLHSCNRTPLPPSKGPH
jgi:hypothetical protein